MSERELKEVLGTLLKHGHDEAAAGLLKDFYKWAHQSIAMLTHQSDTNPSPIGWDDVSSQGELLRAVWHCVFEYEDSYFKKYGERPIQASFLKFACERLTGVEENVIEGSGSLRSDQLQRNLKEFLMKYTDDEDGTRLSEYLTEYRKSH